MLFREHSDPALAISQITHAWISGQLLRAWAEPLEQALPLAAEQHDIAWLDWETAPSFNPRAGRPHCFREVGARVHAPMWRRGVERALGAWGTHVALLVSRHGGVIYRRFTDRHRMEPEDAEAAAEFLRTAAPVEAAWARALGLDDVALERQTALVAFADSLSLALCGTLSTPLELEFPDQLGAMRRCQLVQGDGPDRFVLSPWPFRGGMLTVHGQARPLPPGGRLADAAVMRDWLASPERIDFEAHLSPA